MRLFVDENIPRQIVDWLRNSGHQTRWAAEDFPGASDLRWAMEAYNNDELIITSDKDFGDISYRDRIHCRGVLLLRLDELTIHEKVARLKETWHLVEQYSRNYFIVITINKIRTRPLIYNEDSE